MNLPVRGFTEMSDVVLTDDIVNLSEFEKLAREKLPKMVYDYYASGACDEVTLGDNRAAFDRLRLRPKMLADVGVRSLSTALFGQKISMPVLIAPTAFHGLACSDGEKATARAAARADTIMVLSTLSNFSIEEVLAETKGNVWFQLYVYKDRGVTRDLVERAERAGCKALVFTVDSPLLGRRERDVRNRFHLPPGLGVGNVRNARLENLPEKPNESGLAAYIASLYDTSLSWKDVDWLCSITRLPVLLKGILRGDDAERAIEHGASGIVVSNHGGRQLDGTIATLDALPEVVEAAGERATVLIDGGVRRGTDVVKAIACGAQAVLLGRPVLWGLAADGESGVLRVLEMMRSELDLAMALAGCPTVEDIRRDLLFRPHY